MKIPIKNKDLYAAQPSSWAAPSLKEQEIIFSQTKKKKHEPETHTGTMGKSRIRRNKQ